MMTMNRFPHMLLLLFSVAGSFMTPGTVLAASERISLTLDGAGCPPVKEEIVRLLGATPGVLGVHTDLVPDHILVDVDSTAVSERSLLELVQPIAQRVALCTASVMHSCVTAGPAPTLR
jgi:coenzyme F420-reducing hydrogenase gamma subunit